MQSELLPLFSRGKERYEFTTFRLLLPPHGTVCDCREPPGGYKWMVAIMDEVFAGVGSRCQICRGINPGAHRTRIDLHFMDGADLRPGRRPSPPPIEYRGP